LSPLGELVGDDQLAQFAGLAPPYDPTRYARLIICVRGKHRLDTNTNRAARNQK
jgi:hypothetical protein